MEKYQEQKIADLTVRIDRLTCIASANCMNVAPEVFELDDENVCTFTEDAQETGVERDLLTEACAVCPVDALMVIDEEGNQLVP